MRSLFNRLDKYAGKYDINFQLWGEDRYSIYISKDGIDLADFGGRATANEAMTDALQYLDRINKVSPPSSHHHINQSTNHP